MSFALRRTFRNILQTSFTSMRPPKKVPLNNLCHQQVQIARKFSKCSVFFKSLNVANETDDASYINSSRKNWSQEIVTPTEIKTFLEVNKIHFENGHANFIIPSCPICPHVPSSSEPGTMYLNTTTGWFKCSTCKQDGEWENFVDHINVIGATNPESKPKLHLKPQEPYVDGELLKEYQDSSELTDLSNQEYVQLITKFKIQGMKAETLKNLGFLRSKDGCLIVPLYNDKQNFTALKKLSTEGNKDDVFNSEPTNCFDAMFGLPHVSKDVTEIILTDNPLDMAAVRQEIKNVPCVALPYRTSFLSQHLLPFFENYTRIIFWFSKDSSSWEAIKMFARKLGTNRCSFVRLKDNQPPPCEALSKKYNLVKILKKSETLKHDFITTFKFLRHDVYSELCNAELIAGVKWRRFSALNRLLKGHRRGELTIFTGPTGSGKTTFMSEYSLDLGMQGVNTLWGSFEIQNVRLAKTMLTQYACISLSDNLDRFNYWADRFEQLPIYFMKFYGQQSLKNVLQTMSHAIYVHDIQHVIIDNLQFMMGCDDGNFDRYYKQDLIISDLRKFATEENCHVTLVMHPRKEKNGDDLNTSSIFGGARASQEADNVIILQCLHMPDPKKYIQISKNRFDGTLGIMPLEFDKSSLCFQCEETPPS